MVEALTQVVPEATPAPPKKRGRPRKNAARRSRPTPATVEKRKKAEAIADPALEMVAPPEPDELEERPMEGATMEMPRSFLELVDPPTDEELQIGPGAAMLAASRPDTPMSSPVATFVSRSGARDAPMVDAPPLDPISRALGAELYMINHDFDWSRDMTGFRHRYTRFYFGEGVLVDVFEADTPANRAEMETKMVALTAHNRRVEEGRLLATETPKTKIGYLPLGFNMLPYQDEIDAARAGAMVAFRAPRKI